MGKGLAAAVASGLLAVLSIIAVMLLGRRLQSYQASASHSRAQVTAASLALAGNKKGGTEQTYVTLRCKILTKQEVYVYKARF